MTESSIQDKLAAWLRDKGHALVVPNCGVFGWEADLISVTEAGYANEFEVKISRSDFKADFKKRKHHWLQEPKGSRWQKLSGAGPVNFWYVVPRDLVRLRDVPRYAGLIYVDKDTGWPEIVRPAPRLHGEKADKRTTDYITRGIMARYWSLRAKLKKRRTT